MPIVSVGDIKSTIAGAGQLIGEGRGLVQAAEGERAQLEEILSPLVTMLGRIGAADVAGIAKRLAAHDQTAMSRIGLGAGSLAHCADRCRGGMDDAAQAAQIIHTDQEEATGIAWVLAEEAAQAVRLVEQLHGKASAIAGLLASLQALHTEVGDTANRTVEAANVYAADL